MNAQPVDSAAPPKLPSDASLVVPRGAEPESEIVGPIVGRYDLGERIARGGMGIVYRAHDRLLNRTVAVKVMRSKYMHRPDLLRRFMAEARINGRLQHPGVVPVYEVGSLPDSRPFIAMKLIEGKTLSRELRERHKPSDNQAHYLKVFEALCQAVAFAHQQGVIHRDLKPDNVMVGAFGEVQVMDWGLAKFLDPAAAIAPTPDGFEAIEKSAYMSRESSGGCPAADDPTHATDVVAVDPDTPGFSHTTAGEVFGTLAYMPPEQARGETDRVDRRSDVFSLGAILCQILTGQPPYYGPPETLREMAREGRLFGATVLLDRSGADQPLVQLAKRCLAVESADRPADAGVLATLVTECLDGLQNLSREMETARLKAEARVAEAEAREQLARRARRLARMLAVAGVMVAAMLASGLGWYANDRYSRDADEARRRAAAVQQVSDALAEAESRNGQALDSNAGTLARDAAVRQSLSACHRAEVLLETGPNFPNELRERFDRVKSQAADAERANNLANALDQWRRDLFDSRGRVDESAAAQQCKEIMAAHGVDVVNGKDSSAIIPLLLRFSSVREALVTWGIVSTNHSVRQGLATIAFDKEPPPSWFSAFESNQLEKLARINSDSSVPVVALALAAQRLRDWGRADESEQLLVRGVARRPNSFALNAQLGLLLRAQPGRHTDAVRFLTAARTARPEEPVLSMELGNALADSGRAEEALELLRGAVKADSSLAAAQLRIGDLLAAQKNLDGARESYAAVVAGDSTNFAAQLGLAQVELARGEFDNAERAFQAANAIKRDPTAFAGLARVHVKRQEPAKAAADYRAAVALDPANVDYRLGLIDSLRMSGDSVAALEEAKAATKAAPSSAAAYRALGELLRLSGDKVGAAAALRATIACDPEDVEAQLRLGEICESLDDLPGAAQAFQAAAKLQPNNSRIRTDLARIIARINEPPSTIVGCRRILANDPGNATVRDILGRLLADDCDTSAIDELKKAVDGNPDSGQIRTHLADALLQFGQFRAAAGMYREAAERFPEDSPNQVAARTAARTALRWAGLETRLVEILSGAVTPTTASAWADFGEVCQRTGRFAAATRFFANAAEQDRAYARSATICSALAGFNRGVDVTELNDSKRSELRTTALAALQQHRDWVADSALVVLKRPEALEKLSANERREWQSLWAGKPANITEKR